MIQSDCGLVLRPICLISSATSACLLSEHTSLQQRQTINTHTCKKKNVKKQPRNHGQGFSPFYGIRGEVIRNSLAVWKQIHKQEAAFMSWPVGRATGPPWNIQSRLVQRWAFWIFRSVCKWDIINRRKKGRALEGKWIHYIPHLICSLMEDVSCNREPPTVPGIISNRIALKWAELSLIFLWTKSE